MTQNSPTGTFISFHSLSSSYLKLHIQQIKKIVLKTHNKKQHSTISVTAQIHVLQNTTDFFFGYT